MLPCSCSSHCPKPLPRCENWNADDLRILGCEIRNKFCLQGCPDQGCDGVKQQQECWGRPVWVYPMSPGCWGHAEGVISVTVHRSSLGPTVLAAHLPASVSLRRLIPFAVNLAIWSGGYKTSPWLVQEPECHLGGFSIVWVCSIANGGFAWSVYMFWGVFALWQRITRQQIKKGHLHRLLGLFSNPLCAAWVTTPTRSRGGWWCFHCELCSPPMALSSTEKGFFRGAKGVGEWGMKVLQSPQGDYGKSEQGVVCELCRRYQKPTFFDVGKEF